MNECMVFVSPKMAALFLRVHVSTLTVWRRKGLGPSYMEFGLNTIRYKLDSVAVFLRMIDLGLISESGEPIEESES